MGGKEFSQCSLHIYVCNFGQLGSPPKIQLPLVLALPNLYGQHLGCIFLPTVACQDSLVKPPIGHRRGNDCQAESLNSPQQLKRPHREKRTCHSSLELISQLKPFNTHLKDNDKDFMFIKNQSVMKWYYSDLMVPNAFQFCLICM